MMLRNSVASLLLLIALQIPLAQAELPWQLRVTFKTDPAHQATLSWSSREAAGDDTLQLRVRGTEDWQTLQVSRTGKFSGSPDAWYHHIALTDLQPATEYEVRATDDDDTRWFRTAPDADVPLAILSGGDSRSGIEQRKSMNRMMANLVKEQSAAERPAVLALAHGGDFIVDGRQLDQWLEWLDNHTLTTTSDGQLLPVIPTRGNHDRGDIFNEVWDFPEDDRNYFVTQLTPTVALVTLNTETSTAGDQREWLAGQLPTLRSENRWLLAQYHKPAFPAVKMPSSALASWVPLFDEHRLDLAIESDGHVIKRTPPIRFGKFDDEGVVYIGEGGLGVGQRSPKTTRWYLQPTADKCGAKHHLHMITFTAEQMNIKVVALGGDVFDEFDRQPRN